MIYLHRIMFCLFILVPYFTFNGEAGAKSRHHRHHHRVVDRVVVVEKVVYKEQKNAFPVIAVASVEYPYADISQLLDTVTIGTSSVVDNAPTIQVVPYEYRDDFEYARKLIAAFLICLGLIVVGGWAILLHGDYLVKTQPSFLRIRRRSAWTRATEVVGRSYRVWETHRNTARVQVGNLIRRLRERFHQRSDEALSRSDGKLIQALLQKLPRKYVSRFDISS